MRPVNLKSITFKKSEFHLKLAFLLDSVITIKFRILYSMKIKEQTRKLAAGCSKHCFEVVDRTDEVSNHTYGKATLTWFEFDFRRVLVQVPDIFVVLSDCTVR